jgi:hypothetical protein
MSSTSPSGESAGMGAAPTTTDALLVLLAGVESVGLVMLAVFVMVPVALLAVCTTSWKVAEPAAGSIATLHVIVPVPPDAGVVHANEPLVCVHERNVVWAGTTSVRVTFRAFEGPLFVTEIA